jgi:FkbM family methyltransferase
VQPTLDNPGQEPASGCDGGGGATAVDGGGAAQWPQDRLRLVDVGGAGGLQPKWRKVAGRIFPVMFEPNPAEAAKLRDILSQTVADSLVLETGLSNVTGPQTLNITRYFGCTSLRSPDQELLSGYRIRRLFDVRAKAEVACTRYDLLHSRGEVPAPDAIKIDVQGYEYEVLQGFGGLLQDCIGIELETHVYPIYRNQKLLHHLIAYLADFGFVLRALKPVPHFDGDVVELDAWFTKSIQHWRTFDATRLDKFRLLCGTWDLLDYERVTPGTAFKQFSPPVSPAAS